MFSSETLEVGIGMAFLFLMISLICTAIKEWLEGIFKWRAMDLERALRTLLADPDGRLTEQLMRHPLLDSLFQGNYDPTQLRTSWMTPGKALHMRLSKRRHLPSYIPSAQFAAALLDRVARGPMAQPAGDGNAPAAPAAAALSVESLRQQVLALPSPALQRVLLSALDHAAGDLETAKRNIEQWFNGSMDRASGWYKRRTQAILFMLGLGIAVVMNIDALTVMKRLTVDKAFRDVVVKEAAAAPAPEAGAASAAQMARIANARQVLADVGMPIGWHNRVDAQNKRVELLSWLPVAELVPQQLCPLRGCERDVWIDTDWFPVLMGWLVTAFAVMLGVPFWFDVLNRFMAVRSSVKPKEEKPPEPAPAKPA